MKICKNIVLYLLLLIVMSICGTAVLKVFDLILGVGYSNIWMSGFKVGFLAWIIVLVNEYYHYAKSSK